MIENYQEAVDAILKVFKDEWDILGFPAVYTDVPSEIPTGKVVWARAIIRHAAGNRISMNNPQGCALYDSAGTVFIQVFAPTGKGSTEGYAAADVVARAFQRKQKSKVRFSRVRINEIGTRGNFEQINVLADFNYDLTR